MVSKTLAEVGKTVAPGVTTKELNRVAETFIRDNGAIPSFLGFEGFPAAICTSVNDVVVHGFPSDYVLKEGDIVTADISSTAKNVLKVKSILTNVIKSLNFTTQLLKKLLRQTTNS